MNKKISVLFFILFSVNALLFYNCSPSHMGTSSGNASLDCLRGNMAPDFEATYWAFFKSKNCNSCHSSTGIAGIPHFADNSKSTALMAFLPLGPEKISAKLSTGHQGYDYTSLQPQLQSMAEQWNRRVEEIDCDRTQKTYTQAIPFFETGGSGQRPVKTTMRSPQTLIWDLGGRVPDVLISMDVQVQVNASGMPLGYIVNNMRVKSSRYNVRVRNVTIQLNGSDYSVSTYKYVQADVPKGTTYTEIGEHGSASFFEKNAGERYTNDDGWSLIIETLQAY